MRMLAPQIMRLFAPLSIPSPLSHRWTASADEPIGLVEYLRGEGCQISLREVDTDDELLVLAVA